MILLRMPSFLTLSIMNLPLKLPFLFQVSTHSNPPIFLPDHVLLLIIFFSRVACSNFGYAAVPIIQITDLRKCCFRSKCISTYSYLPTQPWFDLWYLFRVFFNAGFHPTDHLPDAQEVGDPPGAHGRRSDAARPLDGALWTGRSATITVSPTQPLDLDISGGGRVRQIEGVSNFTS